MRLDFKGGTISGVMRRFGTQLGEGGVGRGLADACRLAGYCRCPV